MLIQCTGISGINVTSCLINRDVTYNLSHTLYNMRIFELGYLHFYLVNKNFTCQACQSILKQKLIVVVMTCTGLAGSLEYIKNIMAAPILRIQVSPLY